MIFLGRAGQTIGPITPEELLKLQTTGEISKFHWIWDAERSDWRPLDPPPPPPQGAQLKSSAKKKPSSDVSPLRGKKMDFDLAICHNFRDVLVGKVSSIDEWSCEIFAEQEGGTPQLALNSPIYLDLSKGEQETSLQLRGTLASARREKSGWVYRVVLSQPVHSEKN